jgi:hypothetical protein
MKYILFLFLITVVSTTNAQNTKIQTVSDVETSSGNNHKSANHKSANYSFVVISSVNRTFGYDIYKGKKHLIHQPTIPGLPGNEGFKAKSDAEKVARLVIGKLNNGEMPPSVTIGEMKKLKGL